MEAVMTPTYTGGIDWASDHHDVCVLDHTGRIRTEFRVAHSAAGLAELLTRLGRLGPPERIALALERPSGLLVDTLLSAAYRVAPIHPNALQASRPRYRAAPCKSDAGDAYIAADLLRTDGHRFPVLHPPSDATRALRAVVRTRDDLVATRVQVTNQLRSLLETFWPGPIALFSQLESPISLDFLTTYPTPARAARLGEHRLSQFLRRHHYAGRRSAAELLARLHAAPVGQAGAMEMATRGSLVLALVALLRTGTTELRTLDGLVAAQLAAHPDGALLQSFPRAGTVNAAQILAELGDDRRRYPSPEHLAAEAGVAPVTRASGRQRSVTCRFACNKRLRCALTLWADNTRHANPWAAALYARARSRGCTHPHAIRILARAWVHVLWRCWTDHRAYDITKHAAAQAYLAPAA
jgi:transposase